MRPVPLVEQDYRRSLLRIERAAVVPAKWFVLLVSAGLWLLLFEGTPDRSLLALFLAYGFLTLAETLFIYTGKVTTSGIRAVSVGSYLIDVAYGMTLITLDARTEYLGAGANSNFYILFFLLFMRGFALFRTMAGAIATNILISFLFILTLRLQHSNFEFFGDPDFAVQLILIWLVILMAWYIMMVQNEQAMDLRRVHDHMMRADHLAQVGEMAASVAHEINNPLGIIIATTEYLKKKIPEGDANLEDIEAIYRESNRCKDIMDQLLVYARPETPRLSQVDPVAVNEDVLSFVFPESRSGKIAIERDYAEGTGTIEADANLLKQALLNLYLNAKQSIGEGNEGAIVVRIFPSSRGRRLAIEIVDDGPGIAPEAWDRIFEPFFTQREKGTGLGLPMTQRIVESFQGSISLEPAEPHGIRVRLEFPRSP